MRYLRYILTLALPLVLLASVARAAEPSVALELVTTADSPTYVWNAGDSRLFIVERSGVVRVYTPGQGLLPTPFLDISSQVSAGGERGLYAVAFDPAYATNGYFYVSYSGPVGAGLVSRFQVSANPDVANAASQVDVISVPDPGITHNGGQIAFGPDGYLYLSLGDGGGSHDAQCHAQRNDVLLGKILRLDVSTLPYTIPPDNPFAGANDPLDEVPDEVWAKGFRNPWRFSFDTLTGDLFIGDVGQDTREEINYEPASSPGGRNYGWKVMEGTNCHDPDPIDEACPANTPSCFDPTYTPPVHEYAHGSISGVCAVMGGFVYRGTAITDLHGRYVFGDFCTGLIWTLEEVSPGVWGNRKELLQGPGFLRSFGMDAGGELYAAADQGIYKLVQGAGHLPQSLSQQTCINAMNRQGSEIVKTRARSNVDCIVYGAKHKLHLLGVTAPGATVETCVATDIKNRVQGGLNKLGVNESRYCRHPEKPEQVPDFGYTSAAAVGSAAQAAANRLTASLFGADLNSAIVFQDQNPAGAECQADVAHRARVLLDAHWVLGRAGKRIHLRQRPGFPAVGLPEELAERVIDHVDADPKGSVARALGRLQSALDAGCAGLTLGQLFPGECSAAGGGSAPFAACVNERARCHFCRSFESFDALTIDCDTFDDGVLDGSCPTEAELLCATPGTGVNWAATEVNCPSLLQYRLFSDPEDPRQNPTDDGIPYDLTTPLFSDYALKYRFVFLPPGTQATYDPELPFDFPVGTIIAKTFSFANDLRNLAVGENIIETRLLIRRQLGWEGLPYIWLPDMSDAVLTPEGGSAVVSWIDLAGAPRSTSYEIPSAIECGFCHFGASDVPIGTKARLLNRDFDYPGGTDNQLDHWTAVGALAGAPPSASAPRLPFWDDPLDGTLEGRARAYLESNCHHCHNPQGRAGFTDLAFHHAQPLDEGYGICKEAGDGGAGAGLTYAIVPGEPSESLAIFRMSVTSDGVRMPEIERSVVHDEGVALVSSWIQTLGGTCP